MKRATLTETKNRLSALIDEVREGETILILDRGRPVAKIESALTEGSDQDGRLARLERRGLLARAKAGRPDEVLSEPPPKPRVGASAVAELLGERSEG